MPNPLQLYHGTDMGTRTHRHYEINHNYRIYPNTIYTTYYPKEVPEIETVNVRTKNGKIIKKTKIKKPFPKTNVMKDYTRPNVLLEQPGHKESYQEEMNSRPGVAWLHGVEKPGYRHKIDRTILSLPPKRYCDNVMKCFDPYTEVTVHESQAKPPMRTSSQEHEFTVKKIGQDAKLLHWNEWQKFSVPKLLHKYPGYELLHPDKCFIPHKPGDPDLVPYKHRKAFIRALRCRSNDEAHFNSYKRIKLMGLHINHAHHDGYSIRKYLNT